jgi:hypothetical protein
LVSDGPFFSQPLHHSGSVQSFGGQYFGHLFGAKFEPLSLLQVPGYTKGFGCGTWRPSSSCEWFALRRIAFGIFGRRWAGFAILNEMAWALLRPVRARDDADALKKAGGCDINKRGQRGAVTNAVL